MSELIFESNQEESNEGYGVMSVYDCGTALEFNCHRDYGAKLPAEDARAMHESLGGWLKERPESWQQMADRLGVRIEDEEAGRVFLRGLVGVFSGLGTVRVYRHHMKSPRTLRDLSDCLQVAARYLEEVKGE